MEVIIIDDNTFKTVETKIIETTYKVSDLLNQRDLLNDSLNTFQKNFSGQIDSFKKQILDVQSTLDLASQSGISIVPISLVP